MLIIDRGRIVGQGTPESLRERWLGNPTLRVTLAGRVDDAVARLSAIDGALAARTADSGAGSFAATSGAESHFLLEAQPGRDLRAAVFRCAVDHGWTLLELTEEKASLEDIFVRLTTQRRHSGHAGRGGRRMSRSVQSAPSFLSGWSATLRRELRAYFFSPLAYVLLTFFLLVNGFVFSVIVGFLNDPRSRVRGAARALLRPDHLLLAGADLRRHGPDHAPARPRSCARARSRS